MDALGMEDPFDIRDEGIFLIDPTLESLWKAVPEMTDDLLRQSIEKDGIRHSLEVWGETNILVDGHRRFRICKELGITDIPIKKLTFETREEVFIYMRSLQFARRNVSDHERAIETANLYQSLTGDKSINAAEVAAKVTNQSIRSLRRKTQYAKAFQSLSDVMQLLIVEKDVPQKYVVAIAECDKDVQESILSEIAPLGATRVMLRLKEMFPGICGRTATLERSVPYFRDAKPEKIETKYLSGPDLSADEKLPEDRDERLRILFKRVERSEETYRTHMRRLFGEQGLDAGHSYWRRRIDQGLKEIRDALNEIGEREKIWI